MLYLSTFGSAQTNNSPHLTTINKSHVLQRIGFGGERNHAHLVVLETIIHPYKRSIPIKLSRKT
ncbi:MAG: hypothetical protein A3I66_22170 [Burkholderiales bacterium RIFCSPLOWO2_02_FULL_57_36]|nr:MAG: hypothetical protein A3I66_22170 [Burkholderiales bacterium RIFCSPLOWO2_02_FULL_57_36]